MPCRQEKGKNSNGDGAAGTRVDSGRIRNGGEGSGIPYREKGKGGKGICAGKGKGRGETWLLPTEGLYPPR